MKYRFIKNHERQFPIEKMCSSLKISSRGYYKWKAKYFNTLKFDTTEKEDTAH